MAEARGQDRANRKHRDPEQRRQVIVDAAADLLLKEGMAGFTHRKVAACAKVPLGSTTQYFNTIHDLREAGMMCLVERGEQDLRDTALLLKAGDITAKSLAHFLHDYTSDQDRVRAETLFYAAAIYDKMFSPLARRWYEGTVELFCEFMNEQAARALTLFVDGVCMRACFNGEPEDVDFIERNIEALIKANGGW